MTVPLWCSRSARSSPAGSASRRSSCGRDSTGSTTSSSRSSPTLEGRPTADAEHTLTGSRSCLILPSVARRRCSASSLAWRLYPADGLDARTTRSGRALPGAAPRCWPTSTTSTSSTTAPSSGRSPGSRASSGGGRHPRHRRRGALGAFLTELTGDVGRFTTTGNVRNYALYFFLGVVAPVLAGSCF